MSVQIRDGRNVELDLVLTYEFIGATVEGDYPPAGVSYKRFAFEPKPGTEGVLVFLSSTIRSFAFFQFGWKENGKLVVTEDRVARRTHDFNESDELGYFVRANGTIYATGAPQVAPVGSPPVKQVDIVNLFKYVEGKIDASTLDQKARLLELKQRRTKRLEETVRMLRGELEHVEERMRCAETDLRALAGLRIWIGEVFRPNDKLRPRLERWLLRRRDERAYDAVMAGLQNDSPASKATMRVINNNNKLARSAS